MEASTCLAWLVKIVLTTVDYILDALFDHSVIKIFLCKYELEHLGQDGLRILQKVFKPKEIYWYLSFFSFIYPVIMPHFVLFYRILKVSFPYWFEWLMFMKLFLDGSSVRLATEQMEERNHGIKGISYRKNYYLSFIATVKGCSLRKMRLINPAHIFIDTLSFEPLKLQSHVQCKFHKLIWTGGDASDIFEVLS